MNNSEDSQSFTSENMFFLKKSLLQWSLVWCRRYEQVWTILMIIVDMMSYVYISSCQFLCDTFLCDRCFLVMWCPPPRPPVHAILHSFRTSRADLFLCSNLPLTSLRVIWLEERKPCVLTIFWSISIGSPLWQVLAIFGKFGEMHYDRFWTYMENIWKIFRLDPSLIDFHWISPMADLTDLETI